MEFQRLGPRLVDIYAEKQVVNEEELYWKSFKTGFTNKELGAVNRIATNGSVAAICASTRISLLDLQELTIKKTISRSREVVTACSFRYDGKLLVTGDQAGCIQVHDLSSRAILRTWTKHRGPVRQVFFDPMNPSRIASCGDDRLFILYDMSSETVVAERRIHDDALKALAIYPDMPDTFLTGGHDGKVKLFNAISGDIIAEFNHGHPVDSLSLIPGSSTVIVAGANVISLWDVTTAESQSISHHTDSITQVIYDASRNRLLSSSYDKFIKVVNLSNSQVDYSFEFDCGVTTFAVAAEPWGDFLIVGLSSGDVIVRKRGKATSATDKPAVPVPNAGRYFDRGKSVKNDKEATHHKRMAAFDKYLRQFQHQRALEAAIETHDHMIIFAMLEELSRRTVLSSVVLSLDDALWIDLSAFVTKQLTRPEFTPLLLKVADLLIESYSLGICKNPAVDDVVKRLQLRLHTELGFEAASRSFAGSLELMLSQ